MPSPLSASEAQQIARALLDWAELKEKGLVTDAEVAEVKARLLASVPVSEPPARPTRALASPSGAGQVDLHALILTAIRQRDAAGEATDAAAMRRAVAALAAAGALSAADLPLLERMIKAVCDPNISPLKLFRALSALLDEARRELRCSVLCLDLAMLARGSAEQVLRAEEAAGAASEAAGKGPAAPDPAPARTGKPESPPRIGLTGIVRADVRGALDAASACADLAAIGGGAAAVGVALDPSGVVLVGVAVPWAIIVGIGGGVASGRAWREPGKAPDAG